MERDMLSKLAEAEGAVQAAREKAGESRYRLGCHIAAQANWINDPNGLVFFNGEYHVFFQHHPFNPQWGPMHWGHVKSRDLVHWEHLPIAIAPTEGPDEGGCFSGSAVDDDGILTLIYTGHCDGRSPKQVQCIATSCDGINFQKWSGNPVIAVPPPEGSDDFRDPKVWRHGSYWYLIAGSSRDGIGKALIYRSPDLRSWDYMGVAAESDGTMGYMWECPDLFHLGDKDVMVCSPMGMEGHKNIYMVGVMDYESCRFDIEYVGDLDFGPDFYAAQSFEDGRGRRLQIAWMDMWGRPMPTQNDGWAGALTLPRILSLGEDKKLRFQPIPELEDLRVSHSGYNDIRLLPTVRERIERPIGDMAEIAAVFDSRGCRPSRFGLTVNGVDVVCDRETGTVRVEVPESDPGGSGISQTAVSGSLAIIKIHIFIDRSSMELFINDGEAVITNRLYAEAGNAFLELFTESDEVTLQSLDIYDLRSVW